MSRGKIVLLVAGGVGVLVALFVVLFAIQWFTAPARGALQAREQIQSGSNRIAQYNKFFNRCGDVQAKKAQISNTQAQLATAPVRDQSRISANLIALQNLLASEVSQYNADAAKNYTDGQFRDSDLPYQLNVKGATTCVSVY